MLTKHFFLEYKINSVQLVLQLEESMSDPLEDK